MLSGGQKAPLTLLKHLHRYPLTRIIKVSGCRAGLAVVLECMQGTSARHALKTVNDRNHGRAPRLSPSALAPVSALKVTYVGCKQEQPIANSMSTAFSQAPEQLLLEIAAVQPKMSTWRRSKLMQSFQAEATEQEAMAQFVMVVCQPWI